MSFVSRNVFTAISRIVHGPDVVNKIADEVERLNGRRILIVSDPGLVKAKIVDKVATLLGGYEVDVFTEVEPDPSMETVANCVAMARKAEPNVVIGLGGGSALDVAKCTAALVNNLGDVRDYLGVDKIANSAVAKIMIPTTAGTGSEVTNVAVLSLKQEKTKKGIVSRHLVADAAILDPKLTVGLPAGVTASTGMDALTHAIEAYVSRFAQPLTDFFALEAIRKISSHLRTAVHNGDNLQAREEMMMASLFAGLAFGSAATGMVHGLAMPLGGLFGVPHGIANAVLLPRVMRWNLVAALSRYRDVAMAMGEPVGNLHIRDAAQRAVVAVTQLSTDIGIPSHLGVLNIPASAIDELADDAMTNMRQVLPNPRTVERAGLVEILKESMKP